MADLNGKIESASVPILVTIAGSGPQGKPGEPGKTPVLGVDYFTEEDKQEIATQVEESIRSDLPDIGGSVSVDETLTQSGKAADAKVTGDRIGEIQVNMVEHEPMTEPIEIYDPAFADTLADLEQKIASGGVELDTTLTVAGKAADARSVGEAVEGIMRGHASAWAVLQDRIIDDEIYYGDKIDAEVARATQAEADLKQQIGERYSKPSGGIPESDLSAAVQQKLNEGGGGTGWNAEQISLLDELFGHLLYADPAGGGIASRLIASLRGEAYIAYADGIATIAGLSTTNINYSGKTAEIGG